MRAIEAELEVTKKGKGIVTLPPDIEPGVYKVTIIIQDEPATTKQTRGPLEIPVIEVDNWPEGISLRREDMYGDDGR